MNRRRDKPRICSQCPRRHPDPATGICGVCKEEQRQREVRQRHKAMRLAHERDPVATKRVYHTQLEVME